MAYQSQAQKACAVFVRISFRMGNNQSSHAYLCCMQKLPDRATDPNHRHDLRQTLIAYLVAFCFGALLVRRIVDDAHFVRVFAILIRSHISCMRLLSKLAPWSECDTVSGPKRLNTLCNI